MKKFVLASLCSLLVIASAPIGIKSVKAATNATDISVNINWSDFLSRSDMVWGQLPSKWEEGVFLGNGLLGTMFWQEEAAKKLNFEVSRTDVFDHRKGYDPLFSGGRLPNGHFELGYVGGNPTGDMRLSLWNAEANGKVLTDQGSISINSFAHASQNVIVLDVTTTGSESGYTWTWKPDASKSTRYNPPADYVAYPTQTQEAVGDVQVSVQSMPENTIYHTDGQGVGQYATAWKFKTIDANHKQIYISEGFSYPGTTAKQEAVDAVNNAAAIDINSLRASHQVWWHDFYPKSFVTIPDAKKESYYWIQLYKLASATRGDKPIMDLLGPWFKPTGWPGVWWNMNNQFTYAPLYASNHSDLGNSLVNALYDKRAALAANAAPYSSDSYAIGRQGGIDLKLPVTQYNEPGNLAWALQNVWMQYKTTMDNSLLNDKLFPLMKGSLNYFVHILGTKKADGKYHLPNSYSPEYGSAPDANYSLAPLKWLCKAIIEANGRLGLNDSIAVTAQDILTNLTPYPTDPTYGFMIGQGLNLTTSHRHDSHLLMIHPFFDYTYDDATQGALIDQSVDHWLGLPSSFAGFSYPVAAILESLRNNGDAAIPYLNSLLSSSRPNTMYMEASGPVIETPLYFDKAIQEMLMQSYNGMIRIFPAVPTAWQDTQFHQMLAEGGFQVSAKRQGGLTQFVRVQSLAGEPLKIKTGLSGTVKAYGNRTFNVTDLGNGVVQVDLQKDESVILYAGSSLPDLTISPVAVPDKINAWGIPAPVQTRSIPNTQTPGKILLDSMDDAYVRDGGSASTNFGTTPTLVVKSEVVGYNRESYLKFDMSKVTSSVTAAKIKVNVTITSPDAPSQVVELVNNNTWKEGTINWSNKPASTGTVLGTFSPTIGVHEIDVSSQVLSAMAAADKRLSVKIRASQPGATGNSVVEYGAYENTTASNRPVLELGLADLTAPTTTDNSPTGWVNQDTTVNLNATDSEPGVLTTKYIVNDGAEQTGTSVVLTTEGVHTIQYWSVDGAGNTEAQKTATVKIDKTAPLSIASVSPAVLNSSNGWYASDVTVSFSVYDNLSSVAKTEYQVNNGEWITYTGSIPAFGEGIYRIDYRSTDQAGNIEPIKTIEFKVDKTAPALAVQLDKTSIWPANHKMVTVNANLSSSDTVSGVASVVLTSITSNEPDSGQGDIQANIGTTDNSFLLRAERSGQGSGRIYTITYTATDKAGNKTIASVTVTVPHDQSGN
ncbi:DNRLRE domain-containing protein [Paenibacillus sp. LMG 31460]|uniref:DNRLRE domain-containing protein n=1 Tax=Paenibacillus germinis TaxID=2654979 RepID=A0ABX1Z612_9BACL|nr:DNRLRE domain-containing protein [Paenibacillus germinis]NOU88721.1 DNRLRE domain-containing protein [Paenibacillus germinis]